MPVSETIPPVLSRGPLQGLREKIEAALSGSLDECVVLRASLLKLAPHLSADLGYPAKKLTVLERAVLRELEAAKVDAGELQGVIRWLEGQIDLMAHLRLAGAH